MRVSSWVTGLALLLTACEAPPLVGRGAKCHSLSDCQPGLTCVEGRCSDDLSELEGEVPTYEEADAGALDAGVDAGVLDAGVTADAQVPDTGAPRPDAATPDASAPDAGAPRDAGVDAGAPRPDASAPDASAPDAAPMDADNPGEDAAPEDAGSD